MATRKYHINKYRGGQRSNVDNISMSVREDLNSFQERHSHMQFTTMVMVDTRSTGRGCKYATKNKVDRYRYIASGYCI